MYVNNITDRYHQWPMTTPQFLAFLNDKYSDPDGLHHYEIPQTSGDTTVMINVGTDITDSDGRNIYSRGEFTTITNREFEEKRQDTLRSIRLLDPAYVDQFVEEFENLMGASVL
tara:strand:- start:308 stop:649 length:342 start_codon:yes stop_codon:yes gene_type:complete